jgi:hypothetical protein
MYWGEEFREGQLEKILESENQIGTSFYKIIGFFQGFNDKRRRMGYRRVAASGESPVKENTKRGEADYIPFEIRLYGDQEYWLPEGKVPEGCPKEYKKDEPLINSRAMTLDDLEKEIRLGNPFIALLQAWGEMSEEDYAKEWDEGHYVLVTGFDEKNIYFMDPATTGNYTYLSREDFIRRWHDFDGISTEKGELCPGGIKVKNFGLVVYKKTKPSFNFNQLIRMD